MPSPKQSGQPSGGMFQKYTGEQINQIPEGYVEGMGSMGKAYASIGQSVGQMAQYIGQAYTANKEAEAKIQGQLAPYLAGTRADVEQSLKSGVLIKDASGNVVPNESIGITAGMVDTSKLDLYNKTGGDISKLTGTDLTRFAASFESEQAMAKIASERTKTQMQTKKTEMEINELQSRIDERQAAATYMGTMGKVFADSGSAYNPGLNNGATPTVAGTTESRPAPEVKDPGSVTAFVNNSISPTGTPIAPTAAPAATANRYSINFGATESGVFAPDGTQQSAAQRYSLEPTPYETGVDMPTGEVGRSAAVKYSMEGVTSTQEAPAGETTGAILAPAVKQSTVPAPATPAPSAATQAKKAPPAAAADAPAPSPNGSVIAQAPVSRSVADQLTALNTKRSNIVAQRDSVMPAMKQKLDAQKQQVASGLFMSKTQPVAKATLEFLDRSYTLLQTEWDNKLSAVDAEIKGVQNVSAAEQDITKASIKETELAMAKDKAAMEKDKAAREKVNAKKQEIADAPRIGVFNWRYAVMDEDTRIRMRIAPFSVSAVNEMRDQNVGFVKAQGFLTKLDDTLNQRTRAGENYASRFRTTTGNLENWATAELADIFGVATFRKAIVSGGNFSDSDRMFVQKAIAYLNSLDPLNNPEVYKAKVSALGKFINSMYMDGFKANAYDFDEKGIKENIAYFKANGMNSEAAREQKSLDEYKSFSSRFMVNQDSNTGFMSKEEVLKARQELWDLIPEKERQGSEKLKDGTIVDLSKSNPANFKRSL